MANFSLDDLLALEPSTLSRDLTGYITFVYAAPKVGKTTLARDMGALILACENGTRALTGAFVQPIKSWSDIKTIARYAKDKKFKERYKAVAIDTVDIAASLCEKYVCSQLDIATLGEGGWSKNGWATYKKEFEEVFRSISLEGLAVLFISHSKEKEITRPDGTTFTKTVPTVSDSVSSIIKGMSDIIAYGYQEYGTDNRIMVLRSDGTIEAGSRFPHIASRIPFGYDSLVKAINDAIDAEGKEKGAGVIVDSKPAQAPAKELNYDELLAEFNKITSAWMETAPEIYQPKIVYIVEKYLGKGHKFSEATLGQVEQMSLIVDELKDLN